MSIKKVRFVKSKDIAVYPCAYRNSAYDIEAKLNTENNIRRIAGASQYKSYIVSYTYNNNILTSIAFVINGYYFRIKNTAATYLAPETSQQASWYAAIDIKTQEVGSGTMTEYLASSAKGVEQTIDATNYDLELDVNRSTITASNIANLDFTDETETDKYFVGLKLIFSDEDSLTESNYIRLTNKDGTIFKQNLLPRIGSGKYNNSILLGSTQLLNAVSDVSDSNLIDGANNQTIVGKFNVISNNIGAFIVGDGDRATTSSRHNILEAYKGHVNINGAASISGSLTTSDNVTFNGSAKTFSVNTEANINNGLTVSGIIGSASTGTALQVNGSTNITSNTSIGGQLNVSQATTLSNTLNVASSTTLNNSLAVFGATTLSSTLNISGSTTLNNTLSVSGTTSLAGDTATFTTSTINFNKPVTIGTTASNKNLTIYGGLTISSKADEIANLDISTVIKSLKISSASTPSIMLTSDSAIFNTPSVSIQQDLTVSGAATLDAATISKSLKVNEECHFCSTDSTATNYVASFTASSIAFNTAVSIKGEHSFTVSSPAEFTNALSANSGGTLSGIFTTTSATFSGGTFSGITLSGTVTASEATLSSPSISDAKINGGTLSGTFSTTSAIFNGGTFNGTINASGTFSGNISNGRSISLAGSNGITLNTGSIRTSGSINAGSFYATSDRRLKENIEDYIPSGNILDLPIKTFNFKNSKKKQIGCIAQDLQEICPEIVEENSDGYLSIQENKLVYLLLAEVKKLKVEINKLKGGE